MSKLESMHITPAKNHGFTVTHNYTPQSSVSRGRAGGGFMVSPRSEDHVFSGDQHNEMMAHIAKSWGMKNAKEEEAEVAGKE